MTSLYWDAPPPWSLTQCAQNILSTKRVKFAPGRCGCNLKLVIFKIISMINFLNIFCENALKWMAQNLTYHWLALVQVMAWCCQATSHYLNQGWPRSMSPYGAMRPQIFTTRQYSTCCEIWFFKLILFTFSNAIGSMSANQIFALL